MLYVLKVRTDVSFKRLSFYADTLTKLALYIINYCKKAYEKLIVLLGSITLRTQI